MRKITDSVIEDDDADPRGRETSLLAGQASWLPVPNARLTLHPIWMWGLKPAALGLLAVLAASPILVVLPIIADAFNVDISKTGVILMTCLVWASATTAYLFARLSGVLDERDRLPGTRVRSERRTSIPGSLLGTEAELRLREVADEAVRDMLRRADAHGLLLGPIQTPQKIFVMDEQDACPELANGLLMPPVPKELRASLIPYGLEYIISIQRALSVHVDGLRGTLVDFDQEYFEIQSAIYDQVMEFLRSAELEHEVARNTGDEKNARFLWRKCEVMRLWAHYHEIGSVTEVIDFIEMNKEELQLTTTNY
jgi:hypothetical protein